MKTSFKLFLINWFALGAQVLVVLLALRFGGFSTDTLKQQLNNSNAYSLLSEKAVSMTSESSDKQTQSELSFLAPVLKKQLTPEYLKVKSEKLIDDTYAWMQNKTSTEPVLSFSEIKNDLVSKNPKLLDNLKKMAADAKTQLADKQTGEGLDPATKTQMEQLSKFDPESLLNNDFTIPVGGYLKPLKTGYALYNTGLYVLAGVMLLILGAVILLSDNMKSKFRWAAITFLISSIYAAVVAVPAYFLAKASPAALVLKFINIDAGGNEFSKSIVNIIDTLLKTLSQKFLTLEYITVGVLIALAVTCFVVSSMQPVESGGNNPNHRK